MRKQFLGPFVTKRFTFEELPLFLRVHLGYLYKRTSNVWASRSFPPLQNHSSPLPPTPPLTHETEILGKNSTENVALNVFFIAVYAYIYKIENVFSKM